MYAEVQIVSGLDILTLTLTFCMKHVLYRHMIITRKYGTLLHIRNTYQSKTKKYPKHVVYYYDASFIAILRLLLLNQYSAMLKSCRLIDYIVVIK